MSEFDGVNGFGCGKLLRFLERHFERLESVIDCIYCHVYGGDVLEWRKYYICKQKVFVHLISP